MDDRFRMLSSSQKVGHPGGDLNPVPYGNELALNVDEADNSISTELALSIAPRFGVEAKEARRTLREIVGAVNGNWEKLATQYGLSKTQIDDMRPAFGITL